jgi:hypothetical protein
MNRKNFLLQSTTAGAALLIKPLQSISQGSSDPEPYKMETVKEFVIVGHGKLASVKEMLAQYPNLLYCRYDWGNGDFEEAIEGAGHVGNKEIAQYLIEAGARPNIFVLAMLGETNIVKAILEKYPVLLHSKGPHGFTLLHHANKGGKEAANLVDYLQQKGLTETQIKIR